MTKLEIIRKKCIESNEKIVELKFGCFIFWGSGKDKYRAVFETWVSHSNNTIRVLDLILGQQKVMTTKWIEKIIGRTIHLADILLAIQVANLSMTVETSISRMTLEEPLEMSIFYRMGDGEIIGSEWKLYDDNLENQSKECIDFIHSLLK